MAVRRRTFQFDRITFRIVQIEGRALPFGAVARLHGAGRNAMVGEVGVDGDRIESFHAKTKMIDVTPLRTLGSTANAAKLATHGHQVDQGSAGTQLNQADSVVAPLKDAAPHRTIKVHHRVQIDDTQHDMVDVAELEHGSRLTCAKYHHSVIATFRQLDAQKPHPVAWRKIEPRHAANID